jgi:hypothetical protein
MATKSARPASNDGRLPSKVLGRSAATGGFVMKPVAKGASVSLRDIKRAVAAVTSGARKK